MQARLWASVQQARGDVTALMGWGSEFLDHFITTRYQFRDVRHFNALQGLH